MSGNTVAPPRIAERAQPAQWGDDELLTLEEAVALYWPKGPLTVSSLRTAIRDGRLSVIVIARKFLVSPRSIRAMSEPRSLGAGHRKQEAPDTVSVTDINDDPWRAALSRSK